MSPKPITENTLFYGDNFTILREYIPDESIDLIYLDPPSNSNRTYNVLFKGVFISLEPTTSPMEKEAVSAGFYKSPGWNRVYPKIQISPLRDY